MTKRPAYVCSVPSSCSSPEGEPLRRWQDAADLVGLWRCSHLAPYGGVLKWGIPKTMGIAWVSILTYFQNCLNLDDLGVHTCISGNLQMLVHRPTLSKIDTSIRLRARAWYRHSLTWPSVHYPKLWHDTSRLRGQRCQRGLRSVCNACQNMLYLPGLFQSVISNVLISAINMTWRENL